MPHLLEIGLKRELTAQEAATFPFAVPAIAALPQLDVDVPVTLFVGENGSGKSTLLEGIAAAAELPSLGVAEVAVDNTLVQQRRLGSALRLAWRPRSRQGFFLRAEDFFGHLRGQARTDARIARERREAGGVVAAERTDGPGGLHPDEVDAEHFLKRFDSRSHGESFMDLFSTRVRPRGLYLLDEPEAPLSPMKQLVLLERIVRAAEDGAQFIIATHSPILLACPGARIFSFDDPPIYEVIYEQLEHVNVMRNFLNDPDAHLRKLR
ncbi:AAA family ATPase [soil metagenome]